MSNHQQQELCCSIIEQAPDAILFSDREGIIRLWNRGCELIFGFTQSEALGQSLDLIIPEKLRARHWEGYFQVMQTGVSAYGTKLLSVPALHKDGRQLSCAFSIVMLKDQSGTPTGVASIMRDVTDAWMREKGLKEKIAQLEKS